MSTVECHRSRTVCAVTVSAHNGDELLTTAEVADMCAVSTDTVRRWRYDGLLPYVRLGYRTVRHHRADVGALLSMRRVSGDSLEWHAAGVVPAVGADRGRQSDER